MLEAGRETSTTDNRQDSETHNEDRTIEQTNREPIKISGERDPLMNRMRQQPVKLDNRFNSLESDDDDNAETDIDGNATNDYTKQQHVIEQGHRRRPNQRQRR